MKFINELSSNKTDKETVRVTVLNINKQFRCRFVNKNFNNFKRQAHKRGYLIEELKKDIIIVYPEKQNTEYGEIYLNGYNYPLPIIFAKEQKGILKNFLYMDTAIIRKAVCSGNEK